MGEDPLGLDPETMRRLGYQTVDLLVDRLARLGDEPVVRRGTPAELARRLSGPPPAGPERFEDLLEQLFTDVLPFISRNDHPGFWPTSPAAGPSQGSWAT
jgi:aromatic-L-amino-acid decarboxylase